MLNKLRGALGLAEGATVAEILGAFTRLLEEEMTDEEREAERKKRKKKDEEEEELAELRGLLHVAGNAPKGTLARAVLALGEQLQTIKASEEKDPRAVLAELAESRAKQRNISFNEALDQIRAERKELFEEAASFYA